MWPVQYSRPIHHYYQYSAPVMHDSDSGIRIDSEMIPLLTGIGIGINQAFRVSLESESRHCRNRAFTALHQYTTITNNLHQYTITNTPSQCTLCPYITIIKVIAP